MDRTDARRAAYYNYYSSGTWGMAETYDLCIDSSVLGIDGTTPVSCWNSWNANWA